MSEHQPLEDVKKPGIAAQIAATIAMSGMVVCVGLQVLSRYLAHFGVSWTEEVARLFLVWAVALGAVLAALSRAHFRMDLLASRLRPAVRRGLATLVRVLSSLFLLLFAAMGLENCRELADATSPMLGLSAALPAAAIPFGSLGMAIALWRRGTRS